jgi:hypothetical protein
LQLYLVILEVKNHQNLKQELQAMRNLNNDDFANLITINSGETKTQYCSLIPIYPDLKFMTNQDLETITIELRMRPDTNSASDLNQFIKSAATAVVIQFYNLKI